MDFSSILSLIGKGISILGSVSQYLSNFIVSALGQVGISVSLRWASVLLFAVFIGLFLLANKIADKLLKILLFILIVLLVVGLLIPNYIILILS